MCEPVVAPADFERQQQAALLEALYSSQLPDIHSIAIKPINIPSIGEIKKALSIYRNNGLALAVLSLESVFPTLHALLGEDAFAALAKNFWRAAPPTRGDLGEYGAELADFIDAQSALDEFGYLPDCARLDWACHCAERASDGSVELESLQLLQTEEPEALRLVFPPGTCLISSAYPIVSLRAVGGQGPGQDYAQAQAQLAAGEGQHALVLRFGMRVQVTPINAPDARWMAACLAGNCLADALDGAGDGFDFGQWLEGALKEGWLSRVEVIG